MTQVAINSGNVDLSQPSFDVIAEYERYNSLRPKVMQFSDETDFDTNADGEN